MERYILEALQKAVTTAVGVSPPVKYVNRNFTPPDGPWWEIVYIPNNVENEFWDESRTYQGLLRLLLHWPQDDKGAYPAMDEVASVASKFTKGSMFQDPAKKVTVRITDNPNLTGVIEETPEFLLGMSIRYSFFNA